MGPVPTAERDGRAGPQRGSSRASPWPHRGHNRSRMVRTRPGRCNIRIAHKRRSGCGDRTVAHRPTSTRTPLGGLNICPNLIQVVPSSVNARRNRSPSDITTISGSTKRSTSPFMTRRAHQPAPTLNPAGEAVLREHLGDLVEPLIVARQRGGQSRHCSLLHGRPAHQGCDREPRPRLNQRRT